MDNIKDIVIVGGGSAGWITASTLLSDSRLSNIKVTLVESKDIPKIGVGEGTVPIFRDFIQDININIDDLNATLKNGVHYVNWYSDYFSKHNDYYHLFFDNEFKNKHEMNKIIDYNSSFDYLFKDLDNNFKTENFAYHFDATKLVSVLREKCIDMGCKLINGTVDDCKLDNNGNIESIILNNIKIKGDYFVDCTGFHRVLISKMNPEFIDCSNELICDRALTTHIDRYNGKNHYWTTSTALSSGWSWNIPLQNKTGVGYVYSSKFISEDEAKKEFDEYLGINGDYKVIKWRQEFLKESFIKNCVAIGLSAGFIEPMEATHLSSQYISAKLLVDFFIDNSILQFIKYNNSVNKIYIDIRDFLLFHYIFSKKK